MSTVNRLGRTEIELAIREAGVNPACCEWWGELWCITLRYDAGGRHYAETTLYPDMDGAQRADVIRRLAAETSREESER